MGAVYGRYRGVNPNVVEAPSGGHHGASGVGIVRLGTISGRNLYGPDGHGAVPGWGIGSTRRACGWHRPRWSGVSHGRAGFMSSRWGEHSRSPGWGPPCNGCWPWVRVGVPLILWGRETLVIAYNARPAPRLLVTIPAWPHFLDTVFYVQRDIRELPPFPQQSNPDFLWHIDQRTLHALWFGGL